MTEVRGQKSEGRSQMSEARDQMSEVRGQKTEIGRQRTCLRSASLGLRPSGYDPTRRRGSQRTDGRKIERSCYGFWNILYIRLAGRSFFCEDRLTQSDR